MRALLLLFVGLLFAPFSAAAQSPSADPITRFVLSGSPGEFISQSQTWAYTPEDASFQLEQSPTLGNGIRITLYTWNLPRNALWEIFIGGPNNEPLAVGVYENAQRFQFARPGHPRLSIYGQGRGCNELTGSFEIKHLRLDPNGAVMELWFTYVQYCDNKTKPAHGESMFQMDPTTLRKSRSWGTFKPLYR